MNLFIKTGHTFGVTDIERENGKNQQFIIAIPDGKPDRVIEYSKYETWEQISGMIIPEYQMELLGAAIKNTFKELFK